MILEPFTTQEDVDLFLSDRWGACDWAEASEFLSGSELDEDLKRRMQEFDGTPAHQLMLKCMADETCFLGVHGPDRVLGIFMEQEYSWRGSGDGPEWPPYDQVKAKAHARVHEIINKHGGDWPNARIYVTQGPHVWTERFAIRLFVPFEENRQQFEMSAWRDALHDMLFEAAFDERYDGKRRRGMDKDTIVIE